MYAISQSANTDLTATNLQELVAWLKQIMIKRLDEYFGRTKVMDTDQNASGGFATWIARHTDGHVPDRQELLVLMLALIPHLHPGFLRHIIAEYLPDGGDFPEFGGVRGASHRGMLPTGETVLFMLSQDDLQQMAEVYRLLGSNHWFSQQHLLWLDAVPEGEPALSGRLILAQEFVERLTTGQVSRPRFSINFPAEHITTGMAWGDLVLPAATMGQIREIGDWVRYNDLLFREWGMEKKVKAGYRALFHGPPGTGKTLTAALLGKQLGRDVFRIDLSRIVSKYIGETEKNLSRLFDKAEHKDWILFFDEADALFGKRTDIRDAHDKYANQEVAYLLQRIESYNGLVILATNQRSNIDDAFIRRFNSMIHFPMPQTQERHALWRNTFPEQLQVATDIDWLQVAARHELSGASIVNIIHYCALQALAGQSLCLRLEQLEAAILREYMKEGRIV
jgi:hypothetical protein